MRLFTFIFAIMVAFAAFGTNRADSVKIYFRVGEHQFDPALGHNRAVMDGFVKNVRDAVAAGDIERIVVRGYASPDGIFRDNERLARNRCAAIADYIVIHAGVSRDFIEQMPEGIGWGELRCLVEENPDVPSREEVLHIIDNTPVWVFNSAGKVVGGRKKHLMDLHGGRPYNWMLVNLFPYVRNGVGIILYLKKNEVEPADKPDDVSDLPEIPDTLTEVVVSSSDTSAVTYTVDPIVEYEYRHHFALKNNILYDAALMPNLEFEWLINDNWSISLDGDVAWWKPRENKVYRLALISPEVRYHINPRGQWHGMYVGAFVGGGLYQLENGGDGYRGEGGMGGLSFGYMWPIGKHFFMEAALGAGYMYTKYKVYEPRDGHRLYMRTETLNYLGPLKLKFSIAWKFDITKITKVNSAL